MQSVSAAVRRVQRPFAAIGVVLTMTGCIPIPIVHVRFVTSEQQVRANLSSLKSGIGAAALQLRRVQCPARDWCHEADEVAALLARIRGAVREAFPIEAVALRDSLDEVIVRETQRLGAPRRFDAIQQVRWERASGETGYAAASVRAAIERIVETIDTLLSYDRLALTIDVRSDPSAADFVIQIRENAESRRATRTNDRLANVWRGVYTATVRKQGFKDGVLVLDLFNDSRSKVVCTLRPLGDAGESECRVN